MPELLSKIMINIIIKCHNLSQFLPICQQLLIAYIIAIYCWQVLASHIIL